MNKRITLTEEDITLIKEALKRMQPNSGLLFAPTNLAVSQRTEQIVRKLDYKSPEKNPDGLLQVRKYA